MKREAGEKGGVAAWPEHLRWVASRRHPLDLIRRPVPLAVFQQGCLYRNRAVHALESADRAWHIAYSSPNLAGIQAAVSAGLGVSILPEFGFPITGRSDPKRGSRRSGTPKWPSWSPPARARPPAASPISWSNSAPRPIRAQESCGVNETVFFLLYLLHHSGRVPFAADRRYHSYRSRRTGVLTERGRPARGSSAAQHGVPGVDQAGG
jgi:hypothetical protein